MNKIETIELLQELLKKSEELNDKFMTAEQRNECEQFLANLKVYLLY